MGPRQRGKRENQKLRGAPAAPPIEWRRHALIMAALCVCVLAAYSSSFRAGFPFDNAQAILVDSRVHALTPQNIHLILTTDYWYNSSTTGLYRPLTTLSYLFNYAVLGNGSRPAGYHWINFGLHAANVLLVYLAGLAIFRDTPRAVALAAVWGLHPLLTESVTNIVGRADLLAGFGVLAGLLCDIRGASATGRRKLEWLAALVAAQAIGLFSKESAIVLPGIMLLYDLTWRARKQAIAYAALAL